MTSPSVIDNKLERCSRIPIKISLCRNIIVDVSDLETKCRLKYYRCYVKSSQGNKHRSVSSKDSMYFSRAFILKSVLKSNAPLDLIAKVMLNNVPKDTNKNIYSTFMTYMYLTFEAYTF